MNRRTVLAGIGASLSALQTSTALAAEPTRVAAARLDASLISFIAADRGYFKDAGLTVDMQGMPNGEAVTLAMAGNAIDIGCSEIVSLVLAFHRGVPLTLICAGSITTPKVPGGWLFSRNDLKASTGADFTGKTLAVVGLNGFAQYGTQLWIDKTGGDSKSVKFLQLAGAQIGVALQDGRVDGAFVPEPFVSVVRKVAHPVANSMAAIAPTFLTTAHFTTLQYAKAHADDIRRFQNAIKQAAAWANANPDQTAVILERVAKVSPEIVAASTRAYFGSTIDPSQLQPLIDMAAHYAGFPTYAASDMLYRA